MDLVENRCKSFSDINTRLQNEGSLKSTSIAAIIYLVINIIIIYIHKILK